MCESLNPGNTSRFFASLFARLTHWFADATNGITDFFARRVHTQEICTTRADGTEVCASGDQLADILSTGAAAGAQHSGAANGAAGGQSAWEENADGTILPEEVDNHATAATSTLDVPSAANDNEPVEEPPSSEVAPDVASSVSAVEALPKAANDNSISDPLPATATE